MVHISLPFWSLMAMLPICSGFLSTSPPLSSFSLNQLSHPYMSNMRMAIEGLEEKVQKLESWLTDNKVKDLHVSIDKSTKFGIGTGLIAKKQLKKGEVALNIPQSLCLSISTALSSDAGKYLKNFEGWSGDVGVIAFYLLWEKNLGKESKFSPMIDLFPETFEHPLFWSEDDLTIAQQSSTKGIQGYVDDIVDDFQWFKTNVIGRSAPGTFPSEIFNVDQFKWAVAIVTSRSVFIDSELRLVPVLDHANHQPGSEFLEADSGGMGIFGGKSVKALTGKVYFPGDEFFVSYGPKSPAEYLEEHGFVPDFDFEESSCILSYELSEDIDYYYDKLDIIEMLGLETSICFDVFSINNGEPDPEMVRFLRLLTLNVTDAFLFEAVFRNEFWDFMDAPVSQPNEEAVGKLVIQKCQDALDNMCSSLEKDEKILAEVGDESLAGQRSRMLAKIRIGERKALEATMQWFQRDLNALDLKEYYQERRLKELGLDQPLDDLEMLGSSKARDMDW